MGPIAKLVGAATLVAAIATLGGCPIIAGIDHDYASSGVGDASEPDAAGPRDGGHADGRADARDTGPADARPGDATADGHRHDAADAGVDASNDGDATSPDDVTSPQDVGVDACPTACSVAPVTGWTLVAYDPSGAATCPAGFTSMPVQTPTSIGSCACSSCDVTTNPDCQSGLVTTTVGSSCSSVGPSYSANEGACVAGGVGAASSSTFTAPAAIGGTCSATATATNPTTDPGLVCTPAAGCATAACEPALKNSFQTCLYQAGDQACPSASMTKHAVGSSITTTCDDCSCTVKSTGCVGLFHIYGSPSSCSGTPVFIGSTGGSCAPLTGVASGDSYQFTGSATGVSCTNGTSNATDTVNGQATICCGG